MSVNSNDFYLNSLSGVLLVRLNFELIDFCKLCYWYVFVILRFACFCYTFAGCLVCRFMC